jgi:broad specificity phosphatase PhoE
VPPQRAPDAGMGLTILLVRHGESLANDSIALTDRGHEQARAAGQQIGQAFIRDALVYRSPFLRARQTLDGILTGSGIAPDEVRVFEDPRLREVEHGYADVPQQRRLQDVHGAFFYRFNGGESPADCFDRTSGFLEGLMRQVARKSSDKVLIVTHGLTIRCFVMRFLHLTVEQFETMRNPANCDVVTIAPCEAIPASDFNTSRWAVAGLRQPTQS